MNPRSLFASLLVAVTAAAPVLAASGAEGAPLPVALFGRLHFPLLHFPIVLLFVVFLLDVVLRRRFESQKLTVVSELLLAVAAVTAVLTAAAGLAYAAGEDFSGAAADTFNVHRAVGIGVAVASVVLVVARRADGGALAKLYPPLLVATVVGVAVAGHEGGELVHGEGFYTRPLRAADGDKGGGNNDDGPIVSYDDGDAGGDARTRYPEGTIPEKPDYKLHIQPLFERSCVKCHGPEKRKSGLRLDEKRYAMKGGESGPVSIVPGDPDKSLVYTMCGKAPDDEDVMPPKGKLLALSEIETLKRWIEQGAAWPEPSR